MFIRSQNENVIANLNSVWYIPKKDNNITTYVICVNGASFAEYSTQSQALKIIDEIFSKLQSNGVVYALPKNQEYDVEVIVNETN